MGRTAYILRTLPSSGYDTSPSVCISWCPRFRDADSPPSAASAMAEDSREARDVLWFSSLIGVAECLKRISYCAWPKG